LEVNCSLPVCHQRLTFSAHIGMSEKCPTATSLGLKCKEAANWTPHKICSFLCRFEGRQKYHFTLVTIIPETTPAAHNHLGEGFVRPENVSSSLSGRLEDVGEAFCSIGRHTAPAAQRLSPGMTSSPVM
jgi:hypothetical protein